MCHSSAPSDVEFAARRRPVPPRRTTPSSPASAPLRHTVAGTTRPVCPREQRHEKSPRRTTPAEVPRPGNGRRSRCRAPSSSTASWRKVVRRSNGSTSATWRSGRTRASTIPGSPAPVPMSATVDSSGISRSRTAQFSRCRSHSRGTSRGPIRPRSVPSVASSSAYAASRTAARGNSFSTSGGGVSRETGSVTSRPDPGLGRWSSHHDGWTTTRRRGSSPSDSLVRPAAATTSCTTLRSNGVIGSRRTGVTGGLRLLDRLATDLFQFGLPVRPVVRHVQHQPRPLAGLPVDRQPGQLLQRLQHLAVLTDEVVQLRADDRHRGPVAVDVHVDVAVEIGDVQQLLEVVGGDVALRLQCLQALVRRCSS